MTVTPGKHCPCERHLSISAPGSRAGGGEAAGLRGDVIAESLPRGGRGSGEGRGARRLAEGGGRKRKKIHSSRAHSPRPQPRISMAITSPTSGLFLIWNDPFRLCMVVGGIGLQAATPHNPQSFGGGRRPKALQCQPSLQTQPPLLLAIVPGAGFRLRRKRPGMSFESPAILQGARRELINAELAQPGGEGASAWVGAPGPRCGCAAREACDPEAPLGGRDWGGSDSGASAGGGVPRRPQEAPVGPREILISHLPSSPPPPTLLDSPCFYSFRPELISSLPAA